MWEENRFLNMVSSGSTYWSNTAPDTNYIPLDEDTKADVIVVGGGITGITCAYELAKAGIATVLLETARIVQGTTAKTTGKITVQHGLIYDRLRKTLGEEKSRMYAASNNDAINYIEDRVKEHNIECRFERCPAIVHTLQENLVEQIEKEVDAARAAGIEAELSRNLNSPLSTLAAAIYQNQAKFHPKIYLLALAGEFVKMGGRIHESSEVAEVDEEGSSVLLRNGIRVKGQHIVIATQYPIYEAKGLYFTRLYPKRTYLVAMRVERELPAGMYITAENPTRSLRTHFDGKEQILLCAGEGHTTGRDNSYTQHFKHLAEYADGLLGVREVLSCWSAQDYKTPDDVPYIGSISNKHRNIYIAAGYGKWGMSSGTVAGMLISRMIKGEDNPYNDLFSPLRATPVASAKCFLFENVEVAKELVISKTKPASKDTELKDGEGRVVELDGKKAGAYREVGGKTYLVDLTCTHMGCTLSWNNEEKTWDCPCHGSRFSYDGKRLEGPAKTPLKRLDV